MSIMRLNGSEIADFVNIRSRSAMLPTPMILGSNTNGMRAQPSLIILMR